MLTHADAKGTDYKYHKLKRLGRPATLVDATGATAFAYDPATLRLTTETLPAAFYGSRILSHSYQVGLDLASTPLSIFGRSAGYQFGTAADPAHDFAVSYAYDSSGRLHGLTSLAGSFAHHIQSATAPLHP